MKFDLFIFSDIFLILYEESSYKLINERMKGNCKTRVVTQIFTFGTEF